MRWSSATLGDVAEIVSGSTPKTGTPDYWDGQIPWVTPADLTKLNSQTIDDTPRKLTKSGLASCGARLLPVNSVLFSSRAPIGHVAITGVPMATNQGFKSFVPDRDKLDAKFLYWWLKSNKEYLQGLGVGATFKEVSKSIVAGVRVPLPPLPEQRRIAAILDQADDLRAKRRRTFKILEELEGSIFQGLPERVPTSDWRTMSLSDAYWFQEGPGIRKWQFTDSGVKLLNVGNILKSGQLDLSRTNKHVSDFEAHGKYKHFLVDAGDFVVASSGISFDDDGLLRTRGAFVTGADLPLCMNTSTIRFKAKQGVSTLAYLRSWLSSKSFRVQISRLVTGSAQQNFGPSHLKQTEIALPPLWLQHQHEAQLREISSVRQHHAAHLAKLDELFASLQRRAFTGQL
ncbi:restriction endonuclease subunit S [Homoserinimonas sp. A447]